MKEEVLAAIRARAERGADLSMAAALRRLVAGATHRFGSWRAAVEAAGLDYAAADWPARAAYPVRPQSQVRTALLARRAAGLPLGKAAVRADDPPLAFSIWRIHPVWPTRRRRRTPRRRTDDS